MTDNYRHKGLRRQLRDLLAKKGIKDELVLEAIDEVPRHLFFENAFLSHAYEDKAFPIGAGQTISQPYTVAFQTELLQVDRGMKVLEIGTGSGYQTAILCKLGVKVFSIERQKSLYKKSKALLIEMGYSAKTFFGDGYKGLPTFGPFDRILVTCGADSLPESLLEQLKPGGRMVVPVGAGDDQEMILLEKTNEGIKQSKHGVFRFVPMLKDKNADTSS